MDLLHEDSRAGFEYRRHLVTRLLLANYDNGTRRHDSGYWADLLVLACHNRTLPPLQLQALAQELRTSKVVDFVLASVVRLLHCQPALNASVLADALLTVPGLWFTPGDTRSVFWSENHLLLYFSAAPVLCRLGWAPPRCPAGWRARAWAYLREKQAVGFYEFASGVYSPWTLVGLANLYDLADEPGLRALAAQCAQALVRQLRQYSSEAGLWALPQMRFQGRHDALTWNLVLLSGPQRDLFGYFAGVWDGSTRDFSLYKSTAFVLLVTDLDLFGGVAGGPRLPALAERFTIGRTPAEQRRALAGFAADVGGLDEWDLTALGWSLGAYVGPGTSERTFRLLEHWQLWDNHQFAWAKPWRHGSAHVITNDAGWLLREVTGSSLLHAQAVLWRHGNASLGSFQHYHPGLRGWQQRPLSAGLGRTELWLASGRLRGRGAERTLATHHVSGSDHLPWVEQSQHVALVAFRRSADVALARGLSRTGVRLVVDTFPAGAAAGGLVRGRTEDATGGNWFLFHAPETAAYAAVLTPCGEELCAGSGRRPRRRQGRGRYRQVWAVVVGHPALHGSFENFSWAIARSRVEWHRSGRALVARAQVDGQALALHWPGRQGPILQTTVGLSVYLLCFLVVCALLCWCCCVLYQIRPSTSFSALVTQRQHRYRPVGQRRRRACVACACHKRSRRCLEHPTAQRLRACLVVAKCACVLVLLSPLALFGWWLLALNHPNTSDPGP